MRRDLFPPHGSEEILQERLVEAAARAEAATDVDAEGFNDGYRLSDIVGVEEQRVDVLRHCARFRD